MIIETSIFDVRVHRESWNSARPARLRRVDVAGDAVGESHLAAGGGLIIMLSGQSSFNYYTR